jgi:hypothetical protein
MGEHEDEDPIPTPPPIDWKAVQAHWNMLAKKHGLRTLRCLTDERKRKYRSRTKGGGDQDSFWRTVEAELPNLAGWAKGESERGWVISFDYIVRSDTTFAKFSEGGFRAQPGGNTQTRKPFDPMAGIR